MHYSSTIDRTNAISWIKLALWGVLAAALLYGGRLAPATEAAVGESTIPSPPAQLTVLVGPIDAINTALWTVAGVPIEIAPATRFNDRMEHADVGDWARVEGYPATEPGQLVAARIKILPPHPFISIQGPLEEQSETAAKVGNILLKVTTETRWLGKPAVGIRVRVIAGPDYESGLIAQRIQRAGDPYNDDNDDEAEEPSSDKVELIGIVQHRPNGEVLGLWHISGISVTVTTQTEIKERVGSLVSGAWVKVEGRAEDGAIIAAELKSTETRRYHKFEGILDELADDTITANGITLVLATDVKIAGNPQPGDRVELQGQLNGENLIVTHVDGNRNGDDSGDDHENSTRHITGVVRSLPVEGMVGEWLVGKQKIVVDETTQIYEHKGLVKIDAVVRVEVLKGTQETLVAVEVVVLKEDDDDHNDVHGHHYVKFDGTIQELPDRIHMGDWVISERTVVVSERTEIKGDVSKIKIGARVEIRGYRMANNVIQARKITIEDSDDDNDHNNHSVELTGKIEQLPKHGLIGTWTVAGHDVKVTPKTEIEGNDHIAIGAEVEIRGRKSGNGPIQAERIKIHERAD